MKRQQQGVGWGAGHAFDSPPSDASLSAKRLYVSSCTSLLCGEVSTHGGLPVFISILDSRLVVVCSCLQLAVALVRWYVILQYVGYVRHIVAFQPIDFARRILLPEFNPTKIAHKHAKKQAKGARKQTVKTRTASISINQGGAQLTIQKPHPSQGYPTKDTQRQVQIPPLTKNHAQRSSAPPRTQYNMKQCNMKQ